jgi:hypothetical protein
MFQEASADDGNGGLSGIVTLYAEAVDGDELSNK